MTGSTATAAVPRTAKSAESPFAGVPIPAILEAFPGFPHLNAMLRRAGVGRASSRHGRCGSSDGHASYADATEIARDGYARFRPKTCRNSALTPGR
jgi:hypothetical protein